MFTLLCRVFVIIGIVVIIIVVILRVVLTRLLLFIIVIFVRSARIAKLPDILVDELFIFEELPGGKGQHIVSLFQLACISGGLDTELCTRSQFSI